MRRFGLRPARVLLAVWSALVTLAGCGSRLELPARPNILLVLADDLGYGDPPIYNPGSKIAMPNLERLAREGMRFTDAHSASAVCAPTRYSLITGNYPWRGRREAGVWKAHDRPQILSGQLTLAELLADAGYRTAKVGKHHLGGRFHSLDGDRRAREPEEIDYGRRFGGGPRAHGFDYSYIVPCGIQAPPYAFFRNDKLDGDPETLRHWEVGRYGNSEVLHPGIGSPDWDSSAVGPRLLDEALAFLRAHHRKNLSTGAEAPFFLYYSAVEAHWPWTPVDSLRGHPVAGVTGLSPRADLVHQFDLAVGELMTGLESLGLLDDTLVIVTSDNGGDVGDLQRRGGHSPSGQLAGHKGLLAEGGHRVPLIARWGDGTATGSHIAPGSISRELTGLQDLTATLAHLVGSELPPEQALDSFDFLPVLLGRREGGAPVRDHLIVQDSQLNHALREGEWKVVLDREGTAQELFHLDSTGSEQSAREVLTEAEYLARSQAMEDRFATLRAAERTAPPPANGG